LFRATTCGGGAATSFAGETGAGEVDGDADGLAACDADRGGAMGAGSGVETAVGGVCGGGVVAAGAAGLGVVATGAAGVGVVATGAAGVGAVASGAVRGGVTGAAGRLATRTAGAGRGGSGGAKNAIRSDNPMKPIATAAPPYKSSILIERPRFRGRGCRAYPSVASTESECDSPRESSSSFGVLRVSASWMRLTG
jgi:hypothetical protein